jgi:hypothetical protein
MIGLNFCLDFPAERFSPQEKKTPQPPLQAGRCEKIDLVLFGVIPAKAGIQVFHGLTN